MSDAGSNRGVVARREGDVAPRIVLIDGERAGARRNERVLRAAGGRVEALRAIDELDAEGEWEILLINFDTVSVDDRGALFALMRASTSSRRTLVYSACANRGDLAVLFGTQGLTNLLANSPEVDSEELLITTQKLLGDDIFGLEKYFPWGAPLVTRSVTSSRERAALVELAHSFAIDRNVQPRLAGAFATVADELMTNALFNAPVDADGCSLFAHHSRVDDVVLPGGKSVTVKLGCDGRRLGIAVADPFGSLRVDRVLDYLARCFRKGADQIDSKKGGAGLGLYYVFEALSHFAVNLAPGRCTEMIGLVDVRGSYRDFAAKGKSFNIFVQKNIAPASG